jgi:hypothetical protein
MQTADLDDETMDGYCILTTYMFDNGLELNDDEDVRDAILELNAHYDMPNITDEQIEETLQGLRLVQSLLRAA